VLIARHILVEHPGLTNPLVDPANRFVADTLEAEWNNKLRLLNETQEQYERMRQQNYLTIDDAQRTRIAALANDFPRLWQHPQTPDRERKRMIRLLLEDVTLIKRDQISVHVRFKGGAAKTLALPLPLSAPQLRKTDEAVIHEIDRLLDRHTEREIGMIFNQNGWRSGTGKLFHRGIIVRLRHAYHLKDRSGPALGSRAKYLPPSSGTHRERSGRLCPERLHDFL